MHPSKLQFFSQSTAPCRISLTEVFNVRSQPSLPLYPRDPSLGYYFSPTKFILHLKPALAVLSSFSFIFWTVIYLNEQMNVHLAAAIVYTSSISLKLCWMASLSSKSWWMAKLRSGIEFWVFFKVCVLNAQRYLFQSNNLE